MSPAHVTLDSRDRDLIAATDRGLPLTLCPYQTVAEQLGWTQDEVLQRLIRLQSHGVVRRIALVPNHYQLGFTANGMTVWNVRDEVVSELGQRVGALEFVTHCYLRPRHLPIWPYNLFAMVHGRNRDEVLEKARQIEGLLGQMCSEHQILFSSQVLKKTGFRAKSSKQGE